MFFQQHLAPLGMRDEIFVPSIGGSVTKIWPFLVALAGPLELTHVTKRWLLADVRQSFSVLKPHFWVQHSTHILHVQIVTASDNSAIIGLDFEGCLLKRQEPALHPEGILLDDDEDVAQWLALAATLAVFCQDDHVVEAMAAIFPGLLAVLGVLVTAFRTNVLEKSRQQGVDVLVKALFPLLCAKLILLSELTSQRTSATIRRLLRHRKLVDCRRVDRPLACRLRRYLLSKIRSSPLVVGSSLKDCFLLFGPLRQLSQQVKICAAIVLGQTPSHLAERNFWRIFFGMPEKSRRCLS